MKASTTFDVPSTPCASCGAPVRGIDAQRNCDACIAGGAPSRVPWELVKPAGSPTSGEVVVVQKAA